MQLIYRAQLIEYTPVPVQPYVKPRALNWRFHAPGESYEAPCQATYAYQVPRALNWRFRMAVST